MELRLNSQEANPEALEMMYQFEQHARESGIDKNLYELIKIRASQINGCAFCVDMHAKELQEMGESFDRLMLISVWRDTPIFTEKEKAVLELTECLTQVSEKGVPQAVYENVRKHVDEREYVAIVMAVNVINCWNRLSISTGLFPGCFV